MHVNEVVMRCYLWLRLGPLAVGGDSVTVYCQVIYLVQIWNGNITNSSGVVIIERSVHQHTHLCTPVYTN